MCDGLLSSDMVNRQEKCWHSCQESHFQGKIRQFLTKVTGLPCLWKWKMLRRQCWILCPRGPSGGDRQINRQLSQALQAPECENKHRNTYEHCMGPWIIMSHGRLKLSVCKRAACGLTNNPWSSQHLSVKAEVRFPQHLQNPHKFSILKSLPRKGRTGRCKLYIEFSNC